uniref:Desmoglein 2 n=1 Tax=Nothoprocta perdicaria TaxID=30464 RepID=A0A8C6ZCJ8_NOTPE
VGNYEKVLSHPHSLVRQKREWTVPPAFIREEEDNSYKNPIAKIHSDLEETGIVVTYTISGQGVTEPPYGLFVINGKTGDLNITGRVDREKNPVLLIRGHALDKNGAKLEEPIDLPIKIIDINDNFPVFSHEVFVGSIEELSQAGTIVMRINATDADEPNNLNSKIAFRIISQNPTSAFSIKKDTGEVQVATINLDREAHSSYSLMVEAKDRGGNSDGNAATCSLEIKILDVNDNFPVVESRTLEGSIEENKANVEIMRIKVFDKDEEFSDNWLAKFAFASGNEGGYFHIETDAKTNEGILTLVKELNYEEMQSLNLGIVVTNKAEFHESIRKSYKAQAIPIKINVINVQEGPKFPGGTKIIKTSETMRKNQIIGQYQAIDEDTGKAAERITYLKGRDLANWITIDPNTAEIKLAKDLDYESVHVVNGTYTITVMDYPKKTVTGTVLLQVEDANDNCPIIVDPVRTVCSDTKSIDVTATDLDSYPNSAPFSFTLIEQEGTTNEWMIGSRNDTSIQLIPQNLKTGKTEVPMLIQDHQGFSCTQKQSLQLSVCTCSRDSSIPVCAAERQSAGLGPGAIALIILAILLLLLIPLLLLLCPCRSKAKGFAAIPDGSEAMLRNWNSEGAAPEEKAFVSFVEEDEAQAAKDCLLVYSRGESSSPHGSVGCCSFIESDLDDHFLDDLGDKFKTLAEICMGRHIDMKHSRNESSFGPNDAKPQFLDQQSTFISKQALASGSHSQTAQAAARESAGGADTVSQEVVTETTFVSRSAQHEARPVSKPFAESSVTVTETSYSAAPAATVFLDPQFKENVVVTERVFAPASTLQDMVEVPSLPNGSNIVVTERKIKPEGARPGVLTAPDLPDSQYVLVRERERVLVPTPDQGSLSLPGLSEGQSVVVTERVVTPAQLPGMQSRSEHAAGAGPGLASEGIPPSGSTLSKSSRVTKYSTVQYTRS